MNWFKSSPAFPGRVPAFTVALLLAAVSLMAADCLVPSGGTGSVVTLRKSPTATSVAAGTLGFDKPLPLIAAVPGWYQTRLAGAKAFAAKRSTKIAVCPDAGMGGSTFEIHAIDVGTGLSVLIRGADFSVLYDAGSNDDTARGDANRTLAYLKTLERPLNKLDHVILSHPHRDHVELRPDVVTRFKPGEVWNSGAYNNICGYRNLLLAIAANPDVKYHTATQDDGTTEAVAMPAKECYSVDQPAQTLQLRHAKRIAAGEKIELGRDASMTFLYADGSKHSSLNENSLVVRVDLGTHRVLVMGDAEAGGRKAPSAIPDSTEGDLLACCAADLKADVLVVGHHGSKTSSRAKFLDAVGAKLFVVSAGPTKYATVVLPDDEIVNELEARGQVYRTDLEDGACGASQEKVGPKADGNPGGCDNVMMTLSPNKVVTAEYRHP